MTGPGVRHDCPICALLFAPLLSAINSLDTNNFFVTSFLSSFLPSGSHQTPLSYTLRAARCPAGLRVGRGDIPPLARWQLGGHTVLFEILWLPVSALLFSGSSRSGTGGAVGPQTDAGCSWAGGARVAGCAGPMVGCSSCGAASRKPESGNVQRSKPMGDFICLKFLLLTLPASHTP